MKTRVRMELTHKCFVMGLLLALASAAFAATPEEETIAHLNEIRAIKAIGSSPQIDKYNKQMDAAWKFFTSNKKVALPILRTQLASELGKPAFNSLVLLDVGFFLLTEGEAGDKDLAKRALFSLDPNADIIRWNGTEFFNFAYRVAPDRDAQFLKFAEKAFVRGKIMAIVPQHSMTLDETLVCVFLYGAYGADAEDALLPLLRDPALERKVIEILVWLGSPKSVPGVASVLASRRDYETLARVTSFMM